MAHWLSLDGEAVPDELFLPLLCAAAVRLLPELAARCRIEPCAELSEPEGEARAGIRFAQKQQPTGLERIRGFADYPRRVAVLQIKQHIE